MYATVKLLAPGTQYSESVNILYIFREVIESGAKFITDYVTIYHPPLIHNYPDAHFIYSNMSHICNKYVIT